MSENENTTKPDYPTHTRPPCHPDQKTDISFEPGGNVSLECASCGRVYLTLSVATLHGPSSRPKVFNLEAEAEAESDWPTVQDFETAAQLMEPARALPLLKLLRIFEQSPAMSSLLLDVCKISDVPLTAEINLLQACLISIRAEILWAARMKK